MGSDVPCTSIVAATWQDLDAWAGARAVRRGKSYVASVTALCLTAAWAPFTRSFRPA